MKRALIGIDENCGFALLGPNIQEGEVEFVEIDATEPEEGNRYYSTEWREAAERAASEALAALRARLGATNRTDPNTWITYALDESHPRYCR